MQLTLHLSLRVNNNTGVVLEVDEHSVRAAPGLALTNDDSGGDCKQPSRTHKTNSNVTTSNKALLKKNV
jgi:hypothetical protein